MTKSKVIIPPALQPGSTIGIIAPAGNLHDKEQFASGVRILHDLGFRTKFPRELWPGHDYLADTDGRRIEEFNRMWNDSEVDAVMAARGGFGSLRIVSQLEAPLCPKRFIGFSDTTLLHNHINFHHNMVSLHGPVVTSLPLLSKESLLHFRQMLLHPLEKMELRCDIELLRGSGKTSGILTGGNLCTILSSLGTPQQPQWQGKIVFLEDTAEVPYRLDRMLTQLKLSGLLEGVVTVVLGDFSHGLGLDRTAAVRHHEFIWQRVLELTGDSVPVWASFPIGHGKDNLALPFGIAATLDHERRTIMTR